MPADNLTLRFKEELDNRGVSASLDEVSKFLQAKGMSSYKDTGPYATRTGVPGAAGKGKIPLVPGLRTSEIKPEVSTAQNMFDLAASTLWHGVSSAAIGIPELMLGEEAPYRWDEMQGWGGKVGAVIGEAAGFMVPLKGISMGVKGIMSGMKGTKAIIGKTKQAVRALDLPAGIEADKAARIVEESVSNPFIKDNFLKHYSVSAEELMKAEDGIETYIRMSLKDGFGDAIDKDTIKLISRTARHGLRDKGVHVNDIGSWVEKSLNTRFGVADKSKLTRYIARATEMGLDFAIYNNIANGIQAMAGHEDFNPIGNTWHAFAFTSLLPWVEKFGRGGKIPYFRGKKKLTDMLSRLNPQFYEGLSKDQANAFLKVLRSSEAGLMKTTVGETIKKVAAGRDLSKAEATDALKQIWDTHIKSPERLMTEFRKLAGKDFLESIPRMMLGGFYFNAQTLLDYNMLNNIDPEVLGAHILVGMFFTRMHKPLFPDKTPIITGMEGRQRLMEYFGMDISTIEGLATSSVGRNDAGHIYSGLLSIDIVNAMEKIFNKHREEGGDVAGGIDKETLRGEDYALVRYAFGMHETAQFSREATQENFEIAQYKLENLSHETLKKISADLRELKFERKIAGEDGSELVKLNESNFHEWRDTAFEKVLSGQIREYMKAVVEGANLLGVQNNVRDDWKFDEHDPKSVLEIGRFINLKGLTQKQKDAIPWVYQWQQIRDVLDGFGLIRDIELSDTTRNLHRMDIETVYEAAKKKQPKELEGGGAGLEKIVTNLVDTLRRDNYGETKDVFIDPLQNGFLDAMAHWRHRKSLNQSYGVIEGGRLDAEGQRLRDGLKSLFGDKVPHNLEDVVNHLRIVRPEGYTDEQWKILKNKTGEESADNIKRQITALASIWGNGKQDTDWSSTKEITYDKALSVIKMFEENGWHLTTRFAERVGAHYWNRFLETANITTGTKAVLENFLLYGIARKTTDGSRSKLELPDQETANTLIDSLPNSTLKERNRLKEKYTEILRGLEGIKGKYIDISGRMEFGRKTSATDFGLAVNEAFIMSRAFDKRIYEHYNGANHLVTRYGEWGTSVREYLSELYRYDEQTNEIHFKWEEYTDPETGLFKESAVTPLKEKLQVLIDEGNSEGSLVSKADIILLEQLKNKLVHETSVNTSRAEDNVNTIKAMVTEVETRATKMQALVTEIIYDMDNFSRDRAFGKKRLDASVQDLVTLLKAEGIDTTSLGENPTLPEVLQKFKGTAKGIDAFIDRMSIRLRAWRKNYDEATFIKEQERLSSEYQHLVSETGTAGASTMISSNYGQYSPKFEHDVWEETQLGLRDARNIASELSGKTGGALANQEKENILKEIVGDIRDAIEKKKVTEGLEGPALDKAVSMEHEFFMKTVFPQFLARNIGSESIQVATLGFDSKGNPKFIYETAGHGKGVMTMFFNEMSEVGVSVYKLNHTGTYNNRKQNVENIKDKEGQSVIDRLVDQSTGTDKDDLKSGTLEEIQQSGEIEPVIRVVRVITSFNTSLLVNKDKLYGEGNYIESAIDGRKRGRLNDKFFGWYRNKRDNIYRDANYGLIPDSKRTKGKVYRKKINRLWTDIYDVVVDMFEHPFERETKPDGTKGDKKDIWIVDSKAQRDEQLQAIHDGRGGGTNFGGFESIGEGAWKLRHTKGDHKYVYLRNSKAHKKLLEKLGGVKKSKEQIQEAQLLLKNLDTLYRKLAYGKDPTNNEIRQMVRAMYWDKVTTQGFHKLISNIADKEILQEEGAKLFKYYSLAESSSSKTQGSVEFLHEMKMVDKDTPFLEREQRTSMDYVIDKGKMEIVSVKDESGVGKTGTAANALSNESLVNRALDDFIKTGAYGKAGLTREAADLQKKKLLKLISSLDGSSAINAHTWVGTHFARVAYLHKGRMLRDDIPSELEKKFPHTAGTKPSGWLNSPEGSILMKTNFTYDKKVAAILDKLGIDMLTSESAAKMFNADMLELKSSELKKENKSFDQVLGQMIEGKSVGQQQVLSDKAAINVADKMFQTWTAAKKTSEAVFGAMDVPIKGGVSGAVHLDKIIDAGGFVDKKGGGYYKVEKVIGDKYRISLSKKPDFKDPIRAGLETENNISEMGLENIFFGKTEDRKGLTNVTYALTDFLSQEGINSYLTEYVDYTKKMENALRMTGSLQVGGSGRTGIADFLLHTLREEGAILDNTSTSLTEALFKSGVDPASSLIRDNIQRIAHQWFMKDLRKPKTPGSSYSVLIPFLEGQMPVYATINDKKRSLIYGGKKLSYDDGFTKIEDWGKVKFVASIETALGRRDVQVSRIGSEFEFGDPYSDFGLKNFINKIREQNPDYSPEKAKKMAETLMRVEKEEFKRTTKVVSNRLLKMEDKLKKIQSDGTDVTYNTLYSRLEASNRSLKGANVHDKLYIHSLSLRMPNLGGDVAIHKVEGFYGKEQSNVVGVNLIDIAAIHQADFDVDALLSYHDSPNSLAKEIFKQQGIAPDAKSYGDLAPYKIDMFQRGEDGAAGSGPGFDDPLQNHLSDYLVSRDNFGKVKRVATGVSALQKLEGSLFIEGIPGELQKSKIMDMNSVAYPKFLQRYKNVLQSIVDSMKKPNIMSKAKSEDVIRFILFNEKGNLDGRTYDLINEKASEFYEDGYKPLFEIDPKLHPDVKRVYQDAILESINLLGRSTRILSDVVDESGRRPPEVLEIYEFKNALAQFYKDPNEYIFNILLKKYGTDKKNSSMKNAIIEVFFGAKDFTEVEAVQKYLAKNKFSMKKPTKSIIGLRDGAKDISAERDNPTSVGNSLVEKFNNSTGKYLGYSKKYNENRDPMVRAVDKLLNDVDTASMMLGTEGFVNMFDAIQQGTIVGDAFRERLKEINVDAYGARIDKDTGRMIYPKKRTQKHVEDIRRYSIMSHILRGQKESLEKFIVNGNKYNTTSRQGARVRLRNINALLRHFDNVEHNMIKELRDVRGRLEGEKEYDIGKATKLFEHFDFRDHDFTKDTYKKGGKTGINNSTNKMQYLYKIVQIEGMTKYEKVGYIRPGKTFWAYNKSKYIVLKNPLKWEPLEKLEVLDAYAMLHVTGQVRAEHFIGMESVDYFIAESNQLKSNLGALSREVYEAAKKAPNASDIWMWDTHMEDALVGKFFNDWALKNFDTIRHEGGDVSYSAQQQKIFAVATYLLKPSPVFGDVVHSTNSEIILPSFKMNKRLSKAVFRWLRRHPDGHQVFRDISSEYGRNFRQRYDNIIPQESAPIFSSYFYTSKPSFRYRERSAQLELIFDRGLDLYNPAVFHLVRDELKRYKDRTRPEWDENGELDFMDRYGRYSDIASYIQMYKDVKDFENKKSDRKEVECAIP